MTGLVEHVEMNVARHHVERVPRLDGDRDEAEGHLPAPSSPETRARFNRNVVSLPRVMPSRSSPSGEFPQSGDRPGQALAPLRCRPGDRGFQRAKSLPQIFDSEAIE